MKKNYESSIPNYGKKNHNPPDPFESLGKRRKPQVESIPSISTKEPRRYRVKLGDEIIASNLTSAEAFDLAKQGGAR
jgi:hypothetical protein